MQDSLARRTDSSHGLPVYRNSFNGNVTFSGLLNALDGVASSTSQRILFLTTNHLEKLDPALIRPGRVDLKELIDDATSYQTRELFERFYSDEANLSSGEFEKLRDEMVDLVEQAVAEGTRVSMAALQGHFIRHDAVHAVNEWPELKRQAREDQERRKADEEAGREKVRLASMP